MQTTFKIWSIFSIANLLTESHRLMCPSGLTGKDCKCLDSGPTFLCPNDLDHEIELIISNKKVNLNCVNESAKYFDLLPNVNISDCQSFETELCNSYTTFNGVLKKLDIKNPIQLSFKNMPAPDSSKYDNITKELFDSLTNLEKLSFSHCNLHFAKDFLKNTPNLLILKLIDVKLIEIETYFDFVPKLKRLHLSMNHIVALSNETFKCLVNLTHLHLDQNNLTSLSRNMFAVLKNLQILEISYNNIKEITEDAFAGLGKLSQINLGKNKIKQIYSNIFSNNNLLDTIMLHGNQLLDVPENIFRNCNKLKIIKLKYNQLISLPVNVFKYSKKLIELDLSSNRLTFLQQDLFSSLISLESLDLSNNKIGIVNMSLFQNLPNLGLFLRYNEIRQYPDTSGLKLKQLDLSFNQINYVEISNIIASSVFNINLKNNTIARVGFSLWKPILKTPNVYYLINLKNNPIACNCSNYDLIRYNNNELKGTKALVKMIQNGPLCSKKESKLFTELKPDDINCSVLNNCPHPCHCYYKPNLGDIIVNCSSRNLTSFSSIQTNLNLAENGISVDRVFNKYVNITYLDLSGNMLTEIKWIPPYLKELNLENNKIQNLDRHFISILKRTHTLKRLYLKGNPWECNCESLELQKYLRKYFEKVNSFEIYCHNVDAELVNFKDVCKIFPYTTVLLPALLAVFLCLAIVCVIYSRYQIEIKIYLFSKNMCLWFVTEDELDKDKLYDVFISYCHQDEKFVENHLLSELEHGENPYKACIHIRDWIPGKLISEQVVNSIQDSKRTIIVLSNNFVESVWGKLEFRFAHTQAIAEGRTRVIVIVYGDLDEDMLDGELKSYLKNNTYVKWGDKYFWDKLKYALPHSRNRFYERNKIRTKMTLNLDDKSDLMRSNSCNTSTPPITLDPSFLESKHWIIDMPKKISN